MSRRMLTEDAMMRAPTFTQGLLVALLLSLSGAVVFAALSLLWPYDNALRLVIAMVAWGYGAYLVTVSRVRSGRMAVVLLWVAATLGSWYAMPELLATIQVHLLLIWLTRSLYHYRSLLPLLADLAICLLGLAAALWASHQTGSLFLSLWSFFLVQALFVSLPASWCRRAQRAGNALESEARFQRARNRADAALRRLSSLP